MIGKNEKVENEKTNATRVNVISEKRKLLEDTSSKIQEEVRLCFEQLAKVLQTREKQLLRQVRAIHNQQLSLVHSDCNLATALPTVSVDLSRRQDVERSILNFGELLSSDGNSVVVGDAEPYKIEEYVEANKDHISFDKSIKTASEPKNLPATETFDAVLDSSGELSFNTSSEADITSENEITVLQNHNYSSSSDGLRENEDTPQSFDSEATKHINPEELKFNFKEEAVKTTERSPNRPEKIKSKAFDEVFRSTEEEKNFLPNKFHDKTEDNDRTSSSNEEKNFYSSQDCEFSEEACDNVVEVAAASKKAQDCEQHPKQIQQWLQEILVETETEPTIHEVEQFAEISKSRFKEFQFPLET